MFITRRHRRRRHRRCSLQPAASVRTLMKLLKLMGEDHAAPEPLRSVDLMRKSSLGGFKFKGLLFFCLTPLYLPSIPDPSV